MKRLISGMAVFGMCAAVPAGVDAQAFPSKPIRMIVPFAPGGATDTFSRSLAAELTQTLGQAVVVENRPGAGTTIGADLVAKAPPDGHTLLFTDLSTHTITGSLYAKLPYDPLQQLRARGGRQLFAAAAGRAPFGHREIGQGTDRPREAPAGDHVRQLGGGNGDAHDRREIPHASRHRGDCGELQGRRHARHRAPGRRDRDAVRDGAGEHRARAARASSSHSASQPTGARRSFPTSRPSARR